MALHNVRVHIAWMERSATALIGFGEAGSTFARSGDWTSDVTGFDIDLARAAEMQSCGLSSSATREEALTATRMVISLVTADQALAAAQQCAAHLPPDALWCDLNSVAPETKRAAAKVINQAGGRYVDVAVMAPVQPAALSVPLLLSGSDAAEAEQGLAALGFTKTQIVGDQVGQAASIKMLRSVMVKGIEALCDEMAAGAKAAGVSEQVLASLDASEETRSWSERVAYNAERMERHGERRAAEMEEAVKTLRSLGVDPLMSLGTVQRQRQAAGKGAETKDAA